MELWQYMLAWVLYMFLTAIWSYNKSTKRNAYTALLDETDWPVFICWMIFWTGVGVLITTTVFS